MGETETSEEHRDALEQSERLPADSVERETEQRNEFGRTDAGTLRDS